MFSIRMSEALFLHYVNTFAWIWPVHFVSRWHWEAFDCKSVYFDFQVFFVQSILGTGLSTVLNYMFGMLFISRSFDPLHLCIGSRFISSKDWSPELVLSLKIFQCRINWIVVIFYCSQCQFLQFNWDNDFSRTAEQAQIQAAVAQAVALQKTQVEMWIQECKLRGLERQCQALSTLALKASHLPWRHQWAATMCTVTPRRSLSLASTICCVILALPALQCSHQDR